jgi:hypothetical protein
MQHQCIPADEDQNGNSDAEVENMLFDISDDKVPLLFFVNFTIALTGFLQIWIYTNGVWMQCD